MKVTSGKYCKMINILHVSSTEGQQTSRIHAFETLNMNYLLNIIN